MDRYIFQKEVGVEVIRHVLSGRMRELCSLPERFAPFAREARNLILSYLGAESLEESLESAIEKCGRRPTFPLILASLCTASSLPDCPTGSLYLDRSGNIAIRQSSCIYCGRCLKEGFTSYARTELLRSLEILKSGESVTAIVAPSITGQFDASYAELESALRRVGFNRVVNVKIGARMMAEIEGKELENCIECSDWMITSCCASIKELGLRLLPVIEEKHSSAKTPVEYTSALCKEEERDGRIIFIGPCLAKISECSRNANVDSVLLFSELEMLFIAEGIVFSKNSDSSRDEDLSPLSRTNGISNAVRSFCSHPSSAISYSGIKEAELALFSSWRRGERPQADLVEIALCSGGCISGPGNTSTFLKRS